MYLKPVMNSNMIASLSKVIHSNGYFYVSYTLKLVKLYSSINTPFLNDSSHTFRWIFTCGQFYTPMIAALSQVIHSNGHCLNASYTPNKSSYTLQ